MQSQPPYWPEFLKAIGAQAAALSSSVAAAWRDAALVLDAAQQSWHALSLDPPAKPDFDPLFQQSAQSLLFAPLALQQQRKPQYRALAAIQEFETLAADDLRLLPHSANLCGNDLLHLCPEPPPSRFLRARRRLERSHHELPLRESVSARLLQNAHRRASLDGSAMLLFAKAALHAAAPWQVRRRDLLASLAGTSTPPLDSQTLRDLWTSQANQLRGEAARLLAEYDAWAASLSASLAQSLCAAPAPLSQARRNRLAARNARLAAFWSRQNRAALAVMELESHVARVALSLAEASAASLQSAILERTELEAELTAAIDSLDCWTATSADQPFPPPTARLVAPEQRVAEWTRAVQLSARAELPAAIELLRHPRAQPGFSSPWKHWEPQHEFFAAVDAAAHLLLAGFREVEHAHRAVVRQIERAREVVSFAQESANHADGARIIQEGVANAALLLVHQQASLGDLTPVLRESAARAHAAALIPAFLAIEKGRAGLLAHSAGRISRDTASRSRDLAGRAFRSSLRRSWHAARDAFQWTLIRTGWLPAPRQHADPVQRRIHLGDESALNLARPDLPLIYRRLFRLAPVEEPRFLVGRDAELNGLAAAAARWRSGKPASVIVVGARGSGKTSLLNCAAAGLFKDVPVVRATFPGRITTPAALRQALAEILGPESPELAANKPAQPTRRVIIIEELERTFLRRMNGFDAIHHLFEIMYAAPSALWIFSLNETAYTYLDSVLGLGRHFTHRINAMAVRPTDLTAAILQRHNLSGLRLAFAPPPQADPRVAKARRALRLEQDPQRLFLDSLYSHSEGIFRSAYELWQDCIERVEGGVLHMRQPLAPDYSPIEAELTLEDCFVLKAVLQHGSLSDTELAEVFSSGAPIDPSSLRRLYSLEILEDEPGQPTLRVRPEAGRMVRHALTRRNLL